jgi:hypothetical protein
MRSLFVGAAGRRVAWALALYTLLALVLTWPLAAHFTTHVAGDGIDDPSLAWNLWWLKARLVDQLNPDIFHTGWMFHPVDINLAFYTLTPLNGLLSGLSWRPAGRRHLCLCLGQALLCGIGAVQYCQQPVDPVLRALPRANGGGRLAACKAAGCGVGGPVPGLASLG